MLLLLTWWDMQTAIPTSPQLPAPVASYFAREMTAPQTLAQCFTEDALVVDERQEHRGREAIAAWSTSVTTKYTLTTEVLAAEGDTTHTTVRAKVSGNFPGSPIELSYRFTLKDDLIARLEIAP